MVILYRKIGIKPFTFLLTVAFFLGIYQNYQIASQYKLSAFVLALNDYNKYSKFQNKPWTKVSVYTLGILSGIFFEQIQEFKKKRRMNNEKSLATSQVSIDVYK